MLVADTLSVSLGSVTILDGVSVSFAPGTVSALLGPNGAGKTTLLRTLGGELVPRQGSVRFDGRLLSSYSLRMLADTRAVMTQSLSVPFDFTVAEILRLGWVQGDAAGFHRAQSELVTSLKLQSLLPRVFNRLSGGERQRVQFARALLQVWSPVATAGRRYLLLDEPTASLDVEHELQVLRLASRAAERGLTVVMVLHDLNMASRFADQVVLLKDGQLRAAGLPRAVFNSALLADLYGVPLEVEWHERLQRTLIHS